MWYSRYYKEEEAILRQAILDHSKGNNISSLVGLSLVLADKLDVTYHRTINSSIQDTVNKEIQKIKEVDVKITDKKLIVFYKTTDDFDINIFKNWSKAITIPNKVAKYLNKECSFILNDVPIDISDFLN